MKKFNLKLLLALSLIINGLSSTAQLHPPTFYNATQPNFYKDYIGTGLTVTAPSSIAKPLIYTISNDGTTATNNWGGAVTTPLLDIPLIKAAPDSEACSAPAASMAGQVAFIYRGNCEFGAKALVAQNKGAVAVIIVNNETGGPVNMGAGAVGGQVTIPVFMISKEDGDVINAQLNQSQTVTVSITTWGTGKTNDLAVLYNGLSLWHSYVTPKTQMGINNGNPAAYKGYNGAFLANFGTNDASNIKLKSVLTFTPEGSTTPTTLRSDSAVFSSFLAADSIVAIGTNQEYDVHPTGGQKGKFDMTYTLTSDEGDEFEGNNTASYSFFISDDVFSKGRYDFVKNEPIANVFYQLTGGNPFMVGNLYYVPVGNYEAKSSQFAISNNADFLINAYATLLLYKWNDSLFPDSLIQVGELELVGFSDVAFSATDSSGKVYSTNYTSTTGEPTVVLDSNSWYFVAAEIPGDCFLGFDGVMNRYPRTYLRHYNTNTSYSEFFASLYPGTRADLDDDIINNPLLTTSMFVFEGGQLTTKEAVDSARFAQQKTGFTPAITLKIAEWTTSVKGITTGGPEIMLYPNPATDLVTLDLKVKNKASIVSYSIMDLTGKTHKRITHKDVTTDQVSFSTEGLANGTYLFIINVDNQNSVRKFVIQR